MRSLMTVLGLVGLIGCGGGKAKAADPVTCPEGATATHTLREDGATWWACQRGEVMHGPSVVVLEGRVVERITYADGRKEGPALERDGELEKEGVYQADRREGLWLVRRRGRLVRTEPYISGMEHGVQNSYLPDGGLALRQRFDAGTAWGPPLLPDGGQGADFELKYSGRPASWWRSRLMLLESKKSPEAAAMLELTRARAALHGVPLDEEAAP